MIGWNTGLLGIASAWDVFTNRITYLILQVLAVIVLFFVASWIAKKIETLVTMGLERAKFDQTLSRFFATMSYWGLMLLAILMSLSVFGIETTSFAAVIGAASLAVGLAFQGTLSHLAAGVMLLIFRPFKVGDVINVSGVLGKVDAIDLFTTKIDTPDNRRVIVPNGAVFGATIENATFHSVRRVDVKVGTDYSANLDSVRQTLEGVIASLPNLIQDPNRKHTVVLLGLGDSSIDWEVRVWVNTTDFFAVKEALTRGIKFSLDAADIGIPFPQRDVHIKTGKLS
jgi:small conductance mechanosensitive channel